MGEVYLARDIRLERKVALKFLAPELARDQEFLQRFENEARAAADLSHPNIAGIYQLEQHEGRWFHVFEYVTGETLEQRLLRGPLPLPEAMDLGRALATALAHAHGRGVVHRDMKPANVMITGEGVPKILDFGLARRVGESQLTTPGMAIGTVSHMSPEQAEGRPADARSDLWSLGVILYQCATGKLPFEGEHLASVIHQILTTTPTPPRELRSEITPELERVILRCLERDPRRRYASGNDVLSDLGGLRGLDSSGAVSLGPSPRRRYRPRVATWTLGGLLLATVAALALVYPRWTRAPAETTETVRVENEFGEVTERRVPKGSFRKHLTIFFADAPEDGPDLVWLAYGVPELINFDLLQDPFMEAASPYAFFEMLRTEGSENGLEVSRALQRKIASDRLTPWFLTSSLEKEGEDYVLTTTLHETESGREVATHTFRSPDIFSLADEASVQIRRDVEIPEMVLYEQPDLPVTEIMTESEEAYRLLIESSNRITFENDFEGAKVLLDRAVELDPAFALAHFQAYVVYTSTQDVERGREASRAAMQYAYRLPERMRFTVRANHYFNVEQDPEKAMAVSRMWTQLHPDDVQAHQMRAALHILRNEKREAIASYEKILEIDPSQQEILQQVGSLYRQLGEFEEAAQWLQHFIDAHPAKARSFSALAGLYEDMGELEKAEATYDQALLLDESPDAALLVDKARVVRRRGDFEGAEQLLEQARQEARTSLERHQVYEALMNFHRLRGETSLALEARDQMLVAADDALVPLQANAERVESTAILAEAGRFEEAVEQLRLSSGEFEGPYSVLPSIGLELVYLEAGQADSAAVHLRKLQDFVEAFRYEIIRPWLRTLEARIAELRGDPQEALERWNAAIEASPTEATPLRGRGRVLRQLGRLDEAQTALERALKLDPAHPRTNYEAALLFRDAHRIDLAREHVDRAMKAWANADSSYLRAQRAQELRQDLKKVP